MPFDLLIVQRICCYILDLLPELKDNPDAELDGSDFISTLYWLFKTGCEQEYVDKLATVSLYTYELQHINLVIFNHEDLRAISLEKAEQYASIILRKAIEPSKTKDPPGLFCDLPTPDPPEQPDNTEGEAQRYPRGRPNGGWFVAFFCWCTADKAARDLFLDYFNGTCLLSLCWPSLENEYLKATPLSTLQELTDQFQVRLGWLEIALTLLNHDQTASQDNTERAGYLEEHIKVLEKALSESVPALQAPREFVPPTVTLPWFVSKATPLTSFSKCPCCAVAHKFLSDSSRLGSVTITGFSTKCQKHGHKTSIHLAKILKTFMQNHNWLEVGEKNEFALTLPSTLLQRPNWRSSKKTGCKRDATRYWPTSPLQEKNLLL